MSIFKKNNWPTQPLNVTLNVSHIEDHPLKYPLLKVACTHIYIGANNINVRIYNLDGFED